jgi:hypothetical protein
VNLTYWNKWQMLSAIAADKELSVTGKLVAIRLLDHFNLETGQCNPSYNGIAKALGFTRKRAIVGVQDLESRGWITVQRMALSDATGSRGFERNTFCPAFVRMGFSSPLCYKNDTTPRAENDTTPSVENSTTPSVENDTLTIQDKPSNFNTPAGGVKKQPDRKAKGPAEEEVGRALDLLKANYPKRPGPKWSKAKSKLPAILRSGVSADLLATKAREYGQQCDRERREPHFIQQPDTWLNQEGWTIDYAPVAKSPAERPAGTYTDTQWTAFVGEFRRGGSWPPALGPSPDSTACRAPAHILRPASAKVAA